MSFRFCRVPPETVCLRRKGKMADDDVSAVKSHKMALDKEKARLLGFTLTWAPSGLWRTETHLKTELPKLLDFVTRNTLYDTGEAFMRDVLLSTAFTVESLPYCLDNVT